MEVLPSNKLPKPKSGKLVTLVLVGGAVIAAIVARQVRVNRPPSTSPTTQSATDEAY